MAQNNGLPSILRNLTRYSRALRNDLTFEVLNTVTQIESKAKTKVVVDTGKLKQSIYHTMNYQNQTGEVGATEDYAPYIEFGTGGNVSIPSGFSDLASQFKGAGVRTINRAAKPFLIPAFLEESEKFKEKVNTLITRYSGQ
jgi:HK97 gp10 family phage protein